MQWVSVQQVRTVGKYLRDPAERLEVGEHGEHVFVLVERHRL